MDEFVMSFRALHHTKAVKRIETATSIVELAQLEREELEGGEHRASLVEPFAARARGLRADLTDDQHLEILQLLDGKPSIILAALEGDSHSDDDTGPVETREGGESPSEAADQSAIVAESVVRGGAILAGKPSNKPVRIVGRLVRSRQPGGSVTPIGMAQLRRRRE